MVQNLLAPTTSTKAKAPIFPSDARKIWENKNEDYQRRYKQRNTDVKEFMFTYLMESRDLGQIDIYFSKPHKLYRKQLLDHKLKTGYLLWSLD